MRFKDMLLLLTKHACLMRETPTLNVCCSFDGHTYTYARTCIHTCIHVRAHTHTHAYMHARTRAVIMYTYLLIKTDDKIPHTSMLLHKHQQRVLSHEHTHTQVYI